MTRSRNSRRGAQQRVDRAKKQAPITRRGTASGTASRSGLDLFDGHDLNNFSSCELFLEAYMDMHEECWAWDSNDTVSPLAVCTLRDVDTLPPVTANDWIRVEELQSEAEWSVVSPAETSWTLPWEDASSGSTSGVAWQSDVASDAAIADALQEQERAELRAEVAGVMRFAVEASRAQPRAQPRLAASVVSGLRSRLGTCVVCSDSIATVLMEPCGHLALCGGCDERWRAQTSTCVICRTPGTGVSLLAAPQAEEGFALRIVDGNVRLASPEQDGALEGEEKWSALDFTRERRSLARTLRCTVPNDRVHVVAGPGAPFSVLQRSGSARGLLRYGSIKAGGRFAKSAAAAEAARAWHAWSDALARWKAKKKGAGDCASLGGPTDRYAARRARLELRYLAVQCDRAVGQSPSYWNGRASVPAALRSANTRYRSGYDQGTHAPIAEKRRALRQREQDARSWRREERARLATRRAQEREAACEAAKEAEELARAPIECVACESAEACMLALPCRHVALCRPCWDAREREGEECARCGEGAQCVLHVRRP